MSLAWRLVIFPVATLDWLLHRSPWPRTFGLGRYRVCCLLERMRDKGDA